MKSLIEEGVRGAYLGIDISNSMMRTALERLRDYDVNLVVADGFRLPLASNHKFDLIHIDSVLHHLIGKTRAKSNELVSHMLNILSSKLSEDGYIVIEEMYYVSHGIPSFTATMIFYGLKLINYLKLDLSSIAKVIIPGLEVNFYSEDELTKMLSKYGQVKVIKKAKGKISPLQRLFLQKDFGHISFMVKKRFQKDDR
jgi:SAM-dependent methyltransferase